MVVIVNAFRTAIGSFGGSLVNTRPEELVSLIMKNNLSASGYGANIVDEVIVGQTKQSAHAPNIARVAALLAHFPESLPAYTVHRQCGSGMQAVINGAMSILAGQASVVLAGGVESMSQAPHYSVGNRFGPKMGDITLYDSNTESQPRSQPEEIYGRFTMGQTAEWLAEKYNISRQEQDEFAYISQQKAKRAIEMGRFEEEIIPVPVKEGKTGIRNFATDEHPRLTEIETLGTLRPVFQMDGTVTAGNSSGRNDGGSMLLLMSEEKAKQLGVVPMARIRSFAAAGVSPKEMGIGPVPASQMALKKAGLRLEDIDLIELNEAFAAQSLACLREWGIKGDNVNVNGGAIALGHPLGCSGARIVTTLCHELDKQKRQFGLATICVAGGLGMAMVVERWME
ncbi:acetyl-CoA C-acyltransferase [Bacillus sp. AFS076308]|uniref:thiolase family protein n=1 Tax=unclassified Bacillus (in: firmicutes) TaxID=185979 RepID=UPI000BF990BC|nr:MULTISPECIES: thiolase family protein [unclassified Bacillus (in: firmicutes)]PFO06672.1 acetyl-CoA C-acyltransferase [Bacillus sp. AFS076308]PGV52775.1 acetyl-CoA C-acyltransferase [Bacillus sp. AFS037270]